MGKNGLYGAVASDVRAVLTGLPQGQRRNLLVFADYLGPAADAGGQGVRWGDDRPGPENLANDGGIEALVYGWGREWFVASSRESAAEVVVHEVLHNLGAVQDSAPHSTLASHCFDEWDIECYSDDGPRGQSFSLTFGCAGGPGDQSLDCHEDDYFSHEPLAGSYLDLSWNVARSFFLCRSERCDTPAPAADSACEREHPAADGTVFLDGRASSDPDGELVAWDWRDDSGLVFEGGTRRPTVRARVPAPGTYRVRLTVIDDEGVDATTVSEFTAGALPVSDSRGGDSGVGDVPVGTGSPRPERRSGAAGFRGYVAFASPWRCGDCVEPDAVPATAVAAGSPAGGSEYAARGQGRARRSARLPSPPEATADGQAGMISLAGPALGLAF